MRAFAADSSGSYGSGYHAYGSRIDGVATDTLVNDTPTSSSSGSGSVPPGVDTSEITKTIGLGTTYVISTWNLGAIHAGVDGSSPSNLWQFVGRQDTLALVRSYWIDEVHPSPTGYRFELRESYPDTSLVLRPSRIGYERTEAGASGQPGGGNGGGGAPGGTPGGAAWTGSQLGAACNSDTPEVGGGTPLGLPTEEFARLAAAAFAGVPAEVIQIGKSEPTDRQEERALFGVHMTTKPYVSDGTPLPISDCMWRSTDPQPRLVQFAQVDDLTRVGPHSNGLVDDEGPWRGIGNAIRKRGREKGAPDDGVAYDQKKYRNTAWDGNPETLVKAFVEKYGGIGAPAGKVNGLALLALAQSLGYTIAGSDSVWRIQGATYGFDEEKRQILISQQTTWIPWVLSTPFNVDQAVDALYGALNNRFGNDAIGGALSKAFGSLNLTGPQVRHVLEHPELYGDAIVESFKGVEAENKQFLDFLGKTVSYYGREKVREKLVEAATAGMLAGGMALGGVVSGLRRRGSFKGMTVTGETSGGMSRMSDKWRGTLGPGAMRRHHLVPQEMLNDAAFRMRMEALGYTREKAAAFINRQIADITNLQHTQIHAEGWNLTWKTWFQRNPKFTISDIQAQIKSMMQEFELPSSSRGGPKYGR